MKSGGGGGGEEAHRLMRLAFSEVVVVGAGGFMPYVCAIPPCEDFMKDGRKRRKEDDGWKEGRKEDEEGRKDGEEGRKMRNEGRQEGRKETRI